MDPASGALTMDSVATEPVNPSFLALGPRRRFLYAVSEVTTFDGQPGGAVYAYAIDPQTGRLTLLNRQPSGGGAPCHLSVDKKGRFVLVANYVGGSVAVLPIHADGRLGAATHVARHAGSSVHPERQEAPHPHAIVLDPAQRYAFVPDLGLDRVMVYRLDRAGGTLTPAAEPAVPVQPGAGPRHLAFHPQALYAYLLNELDATMTVFACDAAGGRLTAIQTVATLPETYTGPCFAADVQVAPSGWFAYASLRGPDSIAVLAVDPDTGRLTRVGHASTRGRTPRHFALDPSGAFLLAANQDADTLVPFRLDPDTGLPTPTGHVADVPTPACVLVIATTAVRAA
jgi:6-phosphogluconolactonase